MPNPEIVENNITCPVCFEIFAQEIYQCENGHLVCGTCCINLNLISRPQCRCSMQTKSRNRALEELISGGHFNQDAITNPRPNVTQEPITVFNRSCILCQITPIKRVYLVCLFCQNANYCFECYSELKRRNNAHIGHSFELIQSKDQENAYRARLKSEDESLFTIGNFYEDDLALSKSCSKCSCITQRGFICLHCDEFTVLCPTCIISSDYHGIKKSHVYAVVYNNVEIDSTERHLGLNKMKKLNQNQILQASLILFIGLGLALLIVYACKYLWLLSTLDFEFTSY